MVSSRLQALLRYKWILSTGYSIRYRGLFPNISLKFKPGIVTLIARAFSSFPGYVNVIMTKWGSFFFLVKRPYAISSLGLCSLFPDCLPATKTKILKNETIVGIEPQNARL